jgi:DNA-directed RNA polymerase specialized sigma24 family protein
LLYSNLLFETLDEEAVLMADVLDARTAALHNCLEKLPETDRSVINRRYSPKGSIEQVARLLACSTRSAYRSLTRIHDVLFECVNRALDAEGAR